MTWKEWAKRLAQDNLELRKQLKEANELVARYQNVRASEDSLPQLEPEDDEPELPQQHQVIDDNHRKRVLQRRAAEELRLKGVITNL